MRNLQLDTGRKCPLALDSLNIKIFSANYYGSIISPLLSRPTATLTSEGAILPEPGAQACQVLEFDLGLCPGMNIGVCLRYTMYASPRRFIRSGSSISFSSHTLTNTNSAVKRQKIATPIGVRSVRVFLVPVAALWRSLIQRSRNPMSVILFVVLSGGGVYLIDGATLPLAEPKKRIFRDVPCNLSIKRSKSMSIYNHQRCHDTIFSFMPPTRDEFLFEDKLVNARNDLPSRASLHSRMQMIFQDPYASIDPRRPGHMRFSDAATRQVSKLGSQTGKLGSDRGRTPPTKAWA